MVTSGSLPMRALVGAAYLSSIALVVGLLILQSQGAFRDTVNVTGTFATVGDGLPVGADVKLRGVIVGRVSQVDAEPGKFDVRMELKPDFAEEIPAAVQARILPTNLFGAPYVDLHVTGPESPTIRSGATVPEDTSAGSVQMQTVFQKVYDVLVAVKPAKLNVTLSAIADGLRGNGEQIGRMIERADAYVSALNEQTAVFRQDLSLLADALEGVQAAAPDLLRSMDDVGSLAKVIVEERRGLQRLFAAGISSASTTDAFVDDHGARIVRFLDLTGRFSAILAPIAPNIQRSLVGLGTLAGKIATMAPGNDGVHIQGYLVGKQYPLYSAADCPRYGDLAGPNCRRSRSGSAPREAMPDYGGAVGPVGSPEEQNMLARLAGTSDASVGDGLASLLMGPVLRGGTVVLR